MAPLQDLGLGQVLARALSSSTLSQAPTLVSRQTVQTVTVTAGDNGNDAHRWFSSPSLDHSLVPQSRCTTARE
jgi:hypothetical protein